MKYIPFSQNVLHTIFEQKKELLVGYFLEKNSIKNYKEIYNKHKIQPLTVNEKDISFDYKKNLNKPLFANRITTPQEITELTIAISCEPESILFTQEVPKRSISDYHAKEIKIKEKKIVFVYNFSNFDEVKHPEWIKSDLAVLQKDVASINLQIQKVNSQLSKFIASKIKNYKEEYKKVSKISDAIGISLHKQDLQIIEDAKPLLFSQSYNYKKTDFSKYSYYLHQQTFNDILESLHAMASVMERSPHAFREMNEESLRFMFLIPLNAMFVGGVHAESFNYKGKTDILIEKNNQVLFIAECKVWRGKKSLISTIDQLMGYITRTNSKVAIIFFNKFKDFTIMQNTIQSTISNHPLFCEEIFQESRKENELRYYFSMPNDAQKKIELAILSFDIPT